MESLNTPNMHIKNYTNKKATLSLLIMFLLPSFLFVSFNLSSLAIGTLIAAAFIILINFKTVINFNFKSFLFIYAIFIFLFSSSIYTYFFNEEFKPVVSLLWLVVFLSAIILSNLFKNIPYVNMSKIFLSMILLLLFFGWINLFADINCCNYGGREKAVFPFSEESHYALAIGIFSVAFMTAGNMRISLFIAVNILIQSLIFPNLTLLVFSVLSFFVLSFRLKPLVFRILLIIYPIILFLFIYFIASKFEYFLSRLTFDTSSNLTTLVFLQGWELASLNFLQTNGLGLGWQMLGLTTTHLPSITETIISLTGNMFNIEDGGFLASKLIAEFGIIGILISLAYLYFLIKFIFTSNYIWYKIKHSQNKSEIFSLKKRLLFSGVIFGFCVEFFLRGYGYFSPSLFLVFVAIFYLYSTPDKKFINHGKGEVD